MPLKEALMPKCAHKVMVVDDSRLMHSLYECLLPDKELVHASDGEEALGLLHKHRDTDLLVLDVDMPVMDGLTMLSKLRHDPASQTIPVVLVTSRGQPQEIERGLSAGATAYITKPFHASELLNVIDALLLPAQPRN
jgi:two-component system chemotaxis response regulator CheY